MPQFNDNLNLYTNNPLYPINHEILTPNNLLLILKENGFESTKASIARYMQDGLVMRPLQKNTRKEKEERAFYHPLTIIEIMTVMLLFRGDFLEYKSKSRIARITDRDLFLGRLMFYSESITSWKNIDYYYTSVDRFNIKTNLCNDNKLRMSKLSVVDYLEQFEVCFCQDLGIDEYSDVAKCYKSFVYSIYRETFLHLLNKHKHIIDNVENYIITISETKLDSEYGGQK